MNRKLYVEFSAECAYENKWPFVEIIINSEIKYAGFIEENLTVEVEFVSLSNNCVSFFIKIKDQVRTNGTLLLMKLGI